MKTKNSIHMYYVIIILCYYNIMIVNKVITYLFLLNYINIFVL